MSHPANCFDDKTGHIKHHCLQVAGYSKVSRAIRSLHIFKNNEISLMLFLKDSNIPMFLHTHNSLLQFFNSFLQISVGDDCWSVYRRYRRFRELHRNMLEEYSIVSNIEFPSRRYFGNKADRFVRVRRSQLEVSVFELHIHTQF